MRRDSPLLGTLKALTITLTLIAILVAVVGIMSERRARLIEGHGSAPERLPVLHFSAPQLSEGFTAPSDSHVIFTVPSGFRIPRITLLGGADFDQRDRYWGYCFDGHEEENKRAGRRGMAIYTGRFFYSRAELNGQLKERQSSLGPIDLVGILHSGEREQVIDESRASQIEIFSGGETCYLMSSIELPVGLDRDGDYLNDRRELTTGTDPARSDSDGDGVSDGSELFTLQTSALASDSDADGLPDSCEDKDRDGYVDPYETSPTNPDSDRDELCDGNGFGLKCPERRLVSHGQSQLCDFSPNSPYCLRSQLPPVHGEDMNQNCSYDSGETDPTNPETFGIADWQFKWNAYQASLRR